MKFSERELFIHGTFEPNTTINIKVNGTICKSILVDTVIFSFRTHVNVHGTVPITVDVMTGSVTLINTIVKYPAVVNHKAGSISFNVPLKDPMVVIIDRKLIHFPTLTIREGEHITFDHLIVNGPDYWNISSTVDEADLYTPDIDNHLDFITWIDPVWLYEPHTPAHKDNIEMTALIKYLNL